MDSSLIEKLPDEVIYIIGSYLSKEDLDSCFNVCQRWRCIFNSDNVWKVHCLYPEKYLKTYNCNVKSKYKTLDTCLWRQFYECETRLFENWDIGRFKKVKTGIVPKDITGLLTYFDDFGNHWLFGHGSGGITVWNITERVSVQSVLCDTDQIGIIPIRNKLITVRFDFIKVFEFSYPKYELKLEYRFIFSMDCILPSDAVVSDNYYSCSMRYIMIGDIFVGYYENINNIHLPALHIWDLQSAKKIATLSVFQQSFVDFVVSCSGWDIADTEGFDGGLLLFEGDSGHFLVTLIDCWFSLCQVSLFSLANMGFVRVIAQLKSRTAWCFMKQSIVAIYHVGEPHSGGTSHISVYDDAGTFLAKLDFPHSHNPMFSGHFWFSRSRIILIIDSEVNVLTVNRQKKVCKHKFATDKNCKVLKLFEPKYLLLHSTGNFVLPISVWDIESGVELWSLGNMNNDILCTYRFLIQNTEYPGKLLLLLESDEEIEMLDFEI